MAKKFHQQVRKIGSEKQLEGSPAAGSTNHPLGGGLRAAGRLVGWGGVTSLTVFAPTVLLGISALVLLIVVGVVLPAVWSRDHGRRQAAATMLHLLLTAVCGAWFADVVFAAPLANDDRHARPGSRK